MDGPVGVVAFHTALFHGRMHDLLLELLSLCLVADQAKLASCALELERLIGAMGIVTRNADPRTHGTVDVGRLTHIRMTLAGATLACTGITRLKS